MKRARNWKQECALYQRLTVALVYKIGGTVNVTAEEMKQAVEKGCDIALLRGGSVSLKPPPEHQSRIIKLA